MPGTFDCQRCGKRLVFEGYDDDVPYFKECSCMTNSKQPLFVEGDTALPGKAPIAFVSENPYVPPSGITGPNVPELTAEEIADAKPRLTDPTHFAREYQNHPSPEARDKGIVVAVPKHMMTSGPTEADEAASRKVAHDAGKAAARKIAEDALNAIKSGDQTVDPATLLGGMAEVLLADCPYVYVYSDEWNDYSKEKVQVYSSSSDVPIAYMTRHNVSELAGGNSKQVKFRGRAPRSVTLPYADAAKLAQTFGQQPPTPEAAQQLAEAQRQLEERRASKAAPVLETDVPQPLSKPVLESHNPAIHKPVISGDHRDASKPILKSPINNPQAGLAPFKQRIEKLEAELTQARAERDQYRQAVEIAESSLNEAQAVNNDLKDEIESVRSYCREIDRKKTDLQLQLEGYQKGRTITAYKEESQALAHELETWKEDFRTTCKQLEEAREERNNLRKFKKYVHQRLDELGVPHTIRDHHFKNGCRIGGRLDWIKDAILRFQQEASDARLLKIEDKLLTCDMGFLLSGLRGEYSPTNTVIAYELLKAIAKIIRKNRDYGSTVFKPTKLFGHVIGPAQSILVRLHDKFSRIETLIQSGKALVQDESLADTFGDAAAYLMLYVILQQAPHNGLEEALVQESRMDAANTAEYNESADFVTHAILGDDPGTFESPDFDRDRDPENDDDR
jgi:hypothetical protein